MNFLVKIIYLCVGLFLINACTRASVSGTVANLSAGSSLLVFPDTSVFGQSYTSITLTNNGETEAQIISTAMQGSSMFSFSGGSWPGATGDCDVYLKPGQSCQTVLAFSPTASGTFAGTMQVTFFNGITNSAYLLSLSGSTVQGGGLDPTFGASGLTQIDTGYNEDIKDIKIRTNGQIILVGDADNGVSGDRSFMLVGLTSAGLLDSSFGYGGSISVDLGSNAEDIAYSALLLSTGTILVGGCSGTSAALAEFDNYGQLSPTYGTGGVSTLAAFSLLSTDCIHGLAQASAGRIIAVGQTTPLLGNSTFFAARIVPNGLVDTTLPMFGTLGKQQVSFGGANNDNAQAVVIQSDGKIVLSGSTFAGGTYSSATARLSSSGALDATFAAAGKFNSDTCGVGQNDEVKDVIMDSLSRIIVVGYCNTGADKDAFVARYTTAGALDPTFGVGGVARVDVTGQDDVANKVKIQSNGQILVAGYTNTGGFDQFLLMRLNTDGTLDTYFGVGGIVTTSFGATGAQAKTMAIQSDGKIILAGYVGGVTQDIAVARYLP